MNALQARTVLNEDQVEQLQELAAAVAAHLPEPAALACLLVLLQACGYLGCSRKTVAVIFDPATLALMNAVNDALLDHGGAAITMPHGGN